MIQTDICLPSESPIELTLESGTLATVSNALESSVWLAGHSIAGDITELIENGISIRESWAKGTRVLDSLLLARMRDENATSYKLEDVAVRELGLPAWKQETAQYDWVKERNEAGRMCRRKRVDARRWPADARKPQIGDRVVFQRYIGSEIEGKDNETYRLINDKDVQAILES